MYPHQATIQSYNDCVALFKTVRSPEKGKPLRRWARLFRMPDDSFEIRVTIYGEQPLARITQDNMCEFVMPKENFLHITTTLTQALHKLVPVYMERRRLNTYGLVHVKPMSEYADKQPAPSDASVYYVRWKQRLEYFKKHAVEYDQGLKFNLVSGECINGKWRSQVEVPEKRKAWRNALRKWKYGIKARARVGALDGIIDQVWDERNNLPKGANWSKPEWINERWVTLVATSIQKNEYPAEILRGFVQSSSYSYWKPTKPTAAEVVETADAVLKTLSIPLRRELGVLVEDAEA